MFQSGVEDASPTGGGGATVVRTQSHLTRFNTARAMFERMGRGTGSACGAEGRGPAVGTKRDSCPPTVSGGATGIAMARLGLGRVSGSTEGRLPAAQKSKDSEESGDGPPSASVSPRPPSSTSSVRSGTDDDDGGSVLSGGSSLERKGNLSNHQELVQRHRNWFQSFSKSKSPPSGATSPPPSNTPEVR